MPVAKSANGALAKLALGIAAVAALAGVTGRIASADQLSSPWTAAAQPGIDNFGQASGDDSWYAGQGGDAFGGQSEKSSRQSAVLAPSPSAGATVLPVAPQPRGTVTRPLPTRTRSRHSR